MEYRKLIAEWHKKAAKETAAKPFSAFVFEYLAFIALLKTEASVGEKDRDSIQKLKQNKEIKEKYLKCISSDAQLENCWGIIKEKLDERSLSENNANKGRFSESQLKYWNCSSFAPARSNQVEVGIKKGVLRDMRDWENMVEFWYTIRNNMFHGTKDPENDRDQFLVESGYKTLKPLMDVLILR